MSHQKNLWRRGDQLQALCLLAKSLAFSHQSADIIQSYLHQGIVL